MLALKFLGAVVSVLLVVAMIAITASMSPFQAFVMGLVVVGVGFGLVSHLRDEAANNRPVNSDESRFWDPEVRRTTFTSRSCQIPEPIQSVTQSLAVDPDGSRHWNPNL